MKSDQRKILFLDIDGVVLPLSKQTRRRYEDHAPDQRPKPLELLVQFLEKHTDLEVVLSSSWRMYIGLEGTRALLPQHLRHRLIDVTPVIDGGRNRALECNTWRCKQAPSAQFAVIDDCAALFGEGGLPELILVDPCVGLDKQSLERIRELLYGYDMDWVSADWVMPSERTRLDMLFEGLGIKDLFRRWQLIPDEQRLLLGVSPLYTAYQLTEETWPAFKARIENLEEIDRLLHSLFPQNPDLRFQWIKRPNKGHCFAGRTPFDVMCIEGEAGIAEVLSYLRAHTQMFAT